MSGSSTICFIPIFLLTEANINLKIILILANQTLSFSRARVNCRSAFDLVICIIGNYLKKGHPLRLRFAQLLHIHLFLIHKS